jgi:hypothetical protein
MPLSDAKLSRAAAPLWRWMKERHRIYDHRVNHWPQHKWTRDSILRQYRFCNVYRELDNTTKFIRDLWRTPMRNDQHLWFAMVVARMINHPDTLRELCERAGEPQATAVWCNRAERVLAARVRNDDKVYGNAYIITAGGQSGPKYKYTMRCLRTITRHQWPGATYTSLQRMWEWLLSMPGCGRFIAYEIVTDLRWTRYYNGSDHMSWGNPGPGAVRGLNRIVNNDVTAGIGKHAVYIGLMERLTTLANLRADMRWMPRFEVRDIEHSLCETDKYLRAKHGEGRPKQLYKPAGK